MSRYQAIVTLPDGWGAYHSAGGETVMEQERLPVKTGLLDSRCVPLYRMPEVHPLGFDTTAR